jgi:hypothetical protein
MTLIAALMRGNSTIILGDALITSPTNDHKDHPIPTSDLPNESLAILDKQFFVSGLCRKVFPITREICFAFSGDLSEFKLPLTRLCHICKPGIHSIEEIGYWYESSGFTKLSGSSMIIARTRSNQAIISKNMLTFDQHETGVSMMSGTGRDDFLDTFVRRDISGRNLSFGELITQTLAKCARMLAGQHRVGHGLDARFGGAFDLIGSETDGFQEFSGVLYVFRDWWREEDGIKTTPEMNCQHQDGVYHKIDRVYYVTHVDGNMIVIRWQMGGPNGFMIPPPFDLGIENTPSNVGDIKYVVETIIDFRGTDMRTTFPDTAGYSIKIDEDRNRLELPLTLPNDTIRMILDI